MNQPPEIIVSGNSVEIADGDAVPNESDGTDFSSLGLLGMKRTHLFEIGNIGVGPASLLGTPLVQVQGPHAADFRVTAVPARNVASGATTTFEVTFDPSGLGERTATILVLNNDLDENPYDFSVRGVGIMAPEIHVRGNGVPIVDGDASPAGPDGTEFGTANVDGGAVTHSFLIENLGDGELNLVGAPTIEILGSHASDFTVVTPPSTPIAAGEGTSFAISFDPADVGLRTASVRIVNDDADEDVYDFAIQGTGAESEPNVLDLAISKTSHGVDVGPGGSIMYTLAVTNAGSIGATGATVADPFGMRLSELDIVRIVTSGGAATSLNPGHFSSPLTDMGIWTHLSPTGRGIRTEFG